MDSPPAIRIRQRMKRILALLLVFSAHLAFADDFYARAMAGRAASQTPIGSKFDQSLMPLLDEAAQHCDPPGTKLPADELGQFALVGDITPAGKLIDVETKPQTPVTACFARELATHLFQPPPRPGNYPILIQLNVTP